MNKPTHRQIALVIAASLERGEPPENVVQALAAYLIAERRTKDLTALMRDVIDIRTQQGLREVDITTAYPLTEIARTSVKQLVSERYPDTKTVVFNERQSMAVLGGIRLSSSNLQLDATLKSRLRHLLHPIKVNTNREV